MNLRQMEVFRAVMQAGSITGAARALNISQPAVTGAIRHAEDGLKFHLFERIKGRLLPTPEARALYGEIEHIFDRVDVIDRLIGDLKDAKVGTLDIVAIPALGINLLPSVIGEFMVRRRQVRIRFHMLSRGEMLERIANGRADLGFGFLSPRFPRVTSRALIWANLECILPKQHPLCALPLVTAADLAPYPLIAYTSSQGLAPIINGIFAEARLALRPAVEVGLIINAWAMVNQGAGLAIVDPHSAYGALFPDIVRRPFSPAVPVALEVLHAEARPLSRVAANFVSFLERNVSDRGPACG
jgi:DNA-binding transcriptional LysR family regulator